MVNNREKIIINLAGGNHIDLKSISNFFPMLNDIVLETSPNENIDARILPFKEGSFEIILDVINNPIFTTLVFPTLTSFLAIKIQSGKNKGNYKAIRRKDNKDYYDILFDDGTTTKNVSREIINLLKNNRLNKNAKEFVNNYINENRGRLGIKEINSNNEVIYDVDDLKQINFSKTIDTIEESFATEKIWVEVLSWGYIDGVWELKPLNPLQTTGSKAKLHARVRNVDSLNKFIIEENIHLAHKYIEIELGIEYKVDIISGEISGNPTFYLDRFFDKEKSE